MVHFFTPEEANKVLPEVRKLLTRAVEIKSSLDRSRGRERMKLLDEFSLITGKLEHLGVELKDLDTGLIDFPAMKFSEPVYLCWKLGEEEVLYWHGTSEGFRGRKLLRPETVNAR
jgi:hypothetical protein